MMHVWVRLPLLLFFAIAAPVLAHDAKPPTVRAASTVDDTPPGTLDPVPLPPLANPNSPKIPAKELFARKLTPLRGPARSIGSYATGCLAGAVALPFSGPSWQVMRPSRDRYWGNPRLIRFIERLGKNAGKAGWNGLLVGDMSQPRGGPMIDGHSSHQIGLDVDIWFMPMPDHVLTPAEREFDPAVNVVAPDGLGVVPKVWTPAHMAAVRAAAKDPVVTRVFVNAAIKKEMCREAGSDRGWLSKVRPWWGHAEHFHVRLACPAGSRTCKSQSPPPAGDRCGRPLQHWFSAGILHPKQEPPKRKHLLPLAGLPAGCRRVVMAP